MSTVQQIQPAAVMQQPSVVTSGQQAQITGQPQNVIVQPVQTQVTDPRHKNKNTLYGLGITEVVLGGLSVIFAIVAIIIAPSSSSYYSGYGGYDGYGGYGGYRYRRSYYYVGFTYVSQGIWCGIFILVTGALGIRVKSSPTKCLYIVNMIMAIITANVTFAGVVLSGIAAGTSYFSTGLVAMHSLICIFHFVAMILTITHASFCCSGVCYNPNAGVTQQVMYTHSPNMTYAQPQYVHGPNGQLLMVTNQPMQTSVAMNQPTMIQNSVQHYPQAIGSPDSANAPPQYDPNVQVKQAYT